LEKSRKYNVRPSYLHIYALSYAYSSTTFSSWWRSGDGVHEKKAQAATPIAQASPGGKDEATLARRRRECGAKIATWESSAEAAP
jgi:hypothetical protein